MIARRHTELQRRQVLRCGLAGGLAGGLTFAGLPASACEFWTATLRVTHPWTRAAAEGATTAIVCMKFDEVRVSDQLMGADTMLAEQVELAGPDVATAAGPAMHFAIPAGSETHLSEQGTHLRLLGVRMPLDIGRSYPMTLRFANGGELLADITVDYSQMPQMPQTPQMRFR